MDAVEQSAIVKMAIALSDLDLKVFPFEFSASLRGRQLIQQPRR